ncbi:MAG: hypothetical protein IPJ77_08190 [Planctomycetes bacterium]|nr:hypothetical protein [Planctomycetota bacterium]
MAARRTTGAAAGRDSKVRSRAGGEDKAPAQAAGESGGMGFADAITIATTVLLLVAFVMMDKVLGEHFNTGMFFTH